MMNVLQDFFTRVSKANGIWCEPVNGFTGNSIEAPKDARTKI